MTDYLQRILCARVYDVALETPLDPAPNLSHRLNNTVWLKREDLQPVFSFKLRGAYNRMAQLSRDELKRGVIASSAGNHACGSLGSSRRSASTGCRASGRRRRSRWISTSSPERAPGCLLAGCPTRSRLRALP